jgi:hypothetical protein
MRWWKVLGLAGFAGVTATGVVIARAERSRRAATPEEIREQLHTRLAQTQALAQAQEADPAASAAPAAAAPAAAPPGSAPAGQDRPPGG